MTEAELLARWTPEELRAIATRALAGGDDYSRHLLREQLEDEEFDQLITRPSSRESNDRQCAE